mgnify:CR=1 FL=1
MKKQNIVVGVAPTKRGFLSMEEAKRQKEKFMAVIRGIHPDVVTLVDIDDICENGILWWKNSAGQRLTRCLPPIAILVKSSVPQA